MPCLLTGMGSLPKRRPSRVTLQPLASELKASPLKKKSPSFSDKLPELVRSTRSEKDLPTAKRSSVRKKSLQLLDAALMTPKSVGGPSFGVATSPKSVKSAKSTGVPPTPYKGEVYGSPGTPASASSESMPSSPEQPAAEPACPVTPTTKPLRRRQSRTRLFLAAPAMTPEPNAVASKPSGTPVQWGRSQCLSSSRSQGTPSPASRPSCSPSAITSSDLSINGTFCTWRRGNRIGSGSHGCVYKAQDSVTGHIFAVKMADIEMITAEDRQFAERLEAELQICKDLRHPHIVRYLGHAYMDAKLCIKLEYVPGGSLLSLLGEFGPLEGILMQTASRGLLEGLNYLHTHSPPVVHRDIKGANVLVDTDFCVKLADFGCSKRSSNTQSFVTIGSVPWMAPEVINQQSGHGRKADIWSLGCTFIEMATAERPWGADKFNNIMFALRHIGMSEETPQIPEALPEAGQDIIRQMVQRNPSDRMGTQELLDHEFVKGVPSTRPRSTHV